MINRASVVLKYKEPFVNWVNKADPNDNNNISLEEANDDRTLYLIEEEYAEDLKMFVRRNYKMLFENEFWSWYTDKKLWPPKVSEKMFYEWFEIECFSVVEDLAGSKIIDE